MADKIQLKRGLAANWTSSNPILAQGEIGYELDTFKIKLGDGTSAWNDLDYRFSDDQNADEVIVTPIGNLTSTDVQAALEELQTDIDNIGGTVVTDHTQLSNIGTNTHAQIDTHITSTNNPHSVTKSQVGLSNVDNTNDVNKPVSTAQQTALDNKYDASNPSNFIDVSQAPVQPSDIANFENTIQLDARDVANRDRSNHNGTQTASTISDLNTAIQNNETTTTLSFNNTTKVLSYTNEDNTTTNVDLTQFLDDTNLARITNGSVDANTGIATFERDDNTNFTVDFSSLFDDTNLTRIVSGEVSGNDLILTRSDNTTITIDLSPFSVDLSNYYTKTELDGGQLDNRYYTESEINTQQSTQDTNITNNSNNISTEITNRTNADTNLQNQITDNDTDITNLDNRTTTIESDQVTQNNNITQNSTDIAGPVSIHSDVNLTGISSGDFIAFDNGELKPTAVNFGYTLFNCYFEENGGLANNSYEWSMGNGSTGSRIGYIVPENCEIYQMAINVDSANVGTSCSINIRRAVANTADVNNSPIITTPVFTGNNQIQPIAPITLNKGDVLIPQTNTIVGAWSDVRIFFYFRIIASSDNAKTDIKQVTATNVTFSSTTFTNIPSLTSTITLTRTGNLIGDLIYSAARSGGVNSATQFRVVINGDNGQAYSDTLSTFNDTGSATHFLENVPAGTYTISAQAIVDNPILIAAAGLKLTAREQ